MMSKFVENEYIDKMNYTFQQIKECPKYLVKYDLVFKTVDKIDIYSDKPCSWASEPNPIIAEKRSSAGTPIAFMTPVKSACRLVSKSFINVILKLIANRLIIWGTFYVEDGIPN